MKIVADNKKAFHDYFIDDKYEAGIELLGWEVKSARAATVNLADSFIFFENEIPVLKNAHFSPYNYGDVKTQECKRDRRLLLNKSEINKIHTAVKTKGVTCIATKIYFNERGTVKLEIALARGKHTFDKKQTLKERDIARETAKAIKGIH